MKRNWGWVGVVAAAAMAAPMTIMVSQSAFRPDPLKIGTIATIQLLVGVVAVLTAQRLGASTRMAAIITSGTLLFVTMGGVAVNGPPLVVAILAVAAWAAGLLLVLHWSRRDPFWSWLSSTAWIAVFLLVGWVLIGLPPSQPTLPERAASGFHEDSFYLIIVDGYPGSTTQIPELEAPLAGFGEELTALQLTEFPDALANYNFTHAALPTALSLENSLDLRVVDLALIFDRIRGFNETVNLLRQSGYRYVHIESGWSGSGCGPSVDLCYQGLFLDSVVEDLADLSVLAGGFHESSFTLGAVHALDQLSRHIASDDGGDFVFAHILLPHPPVQLAQDCSRYVDPVLDVMTLNRPGSDPAHLARIKAAYIGQVQCVNAKLLELIGQMNPSWSVVITGDHGTDFGGQILKPAELWSRAEIEERFSIFHTSRLPQSCAQSTERDLVNLMRRAVACVSGVVLDPVAPHFEIVPYYGFRHLGSRVLNPEELDF